MTIAKNCGECVIKHSKHCGCCKKCDSCPNCYDLDAIKLSSYIYSIDNKISEYSKSLLCIADWGYACYPISYDTFETLLIYRDYISKYRDSIIHGYFSGICQNEIQRVLEATSKLIGFESREYSNVVIDDSNYDNWVSKHPLCVAWEDWETFIPKVCPMFGIKVIDITNDIKRNCKMLYTLSIANIAYKKDCIVSNFSVKEIDKCKSDFKVISKLENCDFDYDVYMKLLNCKMSNELIKQLLLSGVKVRYGVNKKSPIIVFPSGNRYTLKDLDSMGLSEDILKNNFIKDNSGVNIDVIMASYVKPPIIF